MDLYVNYGLAMDKGAEMIDELKQWEYDKGYDRGRADAIDECIDAIAYCISASECDEVLNKLKEQKNDY